MIFDSGSAADVHALERLEHDMLGWLTTVTAEGQPQTFPVWFLWQDGEALVYSDHRARRNANIAANPRVTLHLSDNGEGGDVVVLEGTARVDATAVPVGEHAAYLAKYGAWIDQFLGSVAAMAAVYTVPIRITPTRGMASGA